MIQFPKQKDNATSNVCIVNNPPIEKHVYPLNHATPKERRAKKKIVATLPRYKSVYIYTNA